jgi:phytoene synthase
MFMKEQYSTLSAKISIQMYTSAANPKDYAVCREVMRTASRNYSFASNFLPSDKLHHVEALYALMRVGDDRVDVSHDGFATRREAIEDWEQAYWRAFACGESLDPVLRAYLNTSIERQIPPSVMAPYFRAMKDDLTINRFETFSDLMGYMEGSAIPVGRAMTYILGVEPPYRVEDALPGADALAVAMQLSNFWRDIGEDWAHRSRIYIPQEDMAYFNYREEQLAAGVINKNFVDLLEFQFARTESYYMQARQAVSMLVSGRLGVMAGLEIYRAIIHAIRRNRYDVFNRRARASRLRKLGLVAKSAFLTLKP